MPSDSVSDTQGTKGESNKGTEVLSGSGKSLLKLRAGSSVAVIDGDALRIQPLASGPWAFSNFPLLLAKEREGFLLIDRDPFNSEKERSEGERNTFK